MSGSNGKPKHQFHFTVDDQEYSTDLHKPTIGQLLEIAGLNPADYGLVLIKGKGGANEKFTDVNATVNMHEKMKFVRLELGGATVS